MSQISDLIKTLKAYLKAKGITYKKLSLDMGVSEITVKRMFANQSFSLARLEEICRIIELEFFDLVLMAKKDSQKKRSLLTLEQETVLADDPRLFAYFSLLLNGFLPSSIIIHYEFSKIDSDKMLLKLDQLELIKLFSDDRFQLLVSNNVNWQKNGPIWIRYQQEFVDDMLSYPFDSPRDRMIFTPAHLSPTSIKSILNKIDNLVAHFSELSELDAALPIENRSSVALVVGFRPWLISSIQKMRRTHPSNIKPSTL